MQKVWLAMCGQLMMQNLANSWHGSAMMARKVFRVEGPWYMKLNIRRHYKFYSHFYVFYLHSNIIWCYFLPSIHRALWSVSFYLSKPLSSHPSISLRALLSCWMRMTHLWKYWQSERYLKTWWPTSIGAKNEGKSARKIIDYWAWVLTPRRQTKFAMGKLNDENFNEFPPKVQLHRLIVLLKFSFLVQ